MFCLELQYSVEYKMQPFSCRHREQQISKQDYEISAVQEILNYRVEPQRWSLEFFISYSEVFIWDLALRLANSFQSHVIKFSICIFSIYFPNYEKLKSFAKTFTPYNQVLIFLRNSYVGPIELFLYWPGTILQYNIRQVQDQTDFYMYS